MVQYDESRRSVWVAIRLEIVYDFCLSYFHFRLSEWLKTCGRYGTPVSLTEPPRHKRNTQTVKRQCRKLVLISFEMNYWSALISPTESAATLPLYDTNLSMTFTIANCFKIPPLWRWWADAVRHHSERSFSVPFWCVREI